MFKTRLLSGILLVIIALVTVITGGNPALCSFVINQPDWNDRVV